MFGPCVTGPTLLALLNMKIDTKSTRRVADCRPAYRDLLRKKFEDESGVKLDELGGIVIDEVSFNEIAVSPRRARASHGHAYAAAVRRR